MAAIEELEKRVEVLEHEMHALLAAVQGRLLAEPTSGQKPRTNEKTDGGKGKCPLTFKEMLEQAGITGEPIGAEKVQEMMLAEGVKPEDCTLSREIMAMREE